MSYVFAQPSVLAAAATDLAGIGSAINQATAAVAAPTTGLAAAAADEVSTALATLFGAYGQQFQAISAQVAPVFDDAGCCWHQSIGKANGGRHWVWGSPRWVSMGSLVRMRRLGATGQGQPVGAVAQRELRAENRPKSRP
ncbi:PE family protein, partial [Mycobacterium tuberculosis]|uniref:PE family protein n=3 Tax=Mycobacterium tuberculosis TaxID=1773 RepID=UPI001F44F0F4